MPANCSCSVVAWNERKKNYTKSSTEASLSQEMMEGLQWEHHHIQQELWSKADQWEHIWSEIHKKPNNEKASKDAKPTSILS